jgi:multisubunit Na+/H+ antiporter MnhE subunit
VPDKTPKPWIFRASVAVASFVIFMAIWLVVVGVSTRTLITGAVVGAAVSAVLSIAFAIKRKQR